MSLRRVLRSSVTSSGSPSKQLLLRGEPAVGGRRFAEHVEHLLHRQALAGAEREQFRRGLDERGEAEIDRELHGIARAVRPHVHDLAGELFQHRRGRVRRPRPCRRPWRRACRRAPRGWCRAPASRSAGRRRPRPPAQARAPVIGCNVLISMNSMPRTSPERNPSLPRKMARTPLSSVMIEITVPSAASATARGCAAIAMPLLGRGFIATASRSQPITSTPLIGEPRLDGAAHAAQSDEADLHRRLTSGRWLFARQFRSGRSSAPAPSSGSGSLP